MSSRTLSIFTGFACCMLTAAVPAGANAWESGSSMRLEMPVRGVVAGVPRVKPGVIGGWYEVPPSVSFYRVPAVPVVPIRKHHRRVIVGPPQYLTPVRPRGPLVVFGFDSPVVGPAIAPLHGVEGLVPTPAPAESSAHPAPSVEDGAAKSPFKSEDGPQEF